MSAFSCMGFQNHKEKHFGKLGDVTQTIGTQSRESMNSQPVTWLVDLQLQGHSLQSSQLEPYKNDRAAHMSALSQHLRMRLQNQQTKTLWEVKKWHRDNRNRIEREHE